MKFALLSPLRLLTPRPKAAPVREAPPPARSRRAARAAVGWFVFAFVAASAGTLLATDVFAPTLRDPEYGRRASRLRARLAENPGRPLVLAVGSSRTGGAICPAAWEEIRPNDPARPDPLLFNLGRAGAGPINQLMMLRRVLAEGIRPAVVLLEYWPPVSNKNGGSDLRRITPDQVFAQDLPVVREYATDGGKFERAAWLNRVNPVWGLKRTLLLQIDPEWLPWSKRTEVLWVNQDPWGWLPGPDLHPEGSAQRAVYLAGTEKLFRPQLKAFAFNAAADRAQRQAVALAREHGAAVGFVYLPESSEFRAWYPKRALKEIDEHMAALSREEGVPVIDARAWLADGFLADGFHLSKRGAGELTRKLAPVVAETFGGRK